MIDVTPFIGLPFADHNRDGGRDCWGLCRLALARLTGITLPDYGDRYVAYDDTASVATAITAGLAEDWQQVDAPQLLGLVIFRIAGHPRHVGLIVGTDRFLHMPPKGDSCVERLSSPIWNRRIEGFYVHR